MQRADAAALKYATRYRQATNEDVMVKYEKNFEYQYTAGADGEAVVIMTSLIGARIIQVEREIKPVFTADWVWNPNNGQLTFQNGVSMAKDETLFIIYARLIEE